MSNKPETQPVSVSEEIAVKLRYEMDAVEYARQQGGMSESDLKAHWNNLSDLVSEIDKLSTTQPTKVDEGWVSVEDRPLFTIESNGWVCTEEGDKEFIAAVPYRRESKPNEDFWWIRHCVVEDETGLCVVGNDYNDPAEWDLEDVTHYKLLSEPPKAIAKRINGGNE